MVKIGDVKTLFMVANFDGLTGFVFFKGQLSRFLIASSDSLDLCHTPQDSLQGRLTNFYRGRINPHTCTAQSPKNCTLYVRI